MTKSCDDDLFIHPIETCSFKALDVLYNKYENDKYKSDINNIFIDDFINEYNDINSKFRDEKTNNKFIYKYDKNKKDLCVPSNLKEDEYQINCVISTNSKYFTYNKKNNSCDAINNLNLGDEFKYIIDENNNNVAIILNTDNFKETHDFKPRKAYCENKWYDWITIPNYHFNNQYYKDSGIYSKEDVRKCYKPCGINLMPYTSIKDQELCVSKQDAYNGIYANKLDYSPIALINLLGNNNETLNGLYISILYDNIQKNKDKRISLNNNDERLKKLLEIVKNNDNIIIQEAKKEIINVIKNNIVNDLSMSISDYKNNVFVLTYKNPKFIENDTELITLRGMITTDMLDNIKLLHTYYLAYKYYNFIDKIGDVNIDFTNNFNYMTQFKNNFIDIINNKDDVKKITKYAMRLGNILFKSINLCFDNISEFSKNIIIYLKQAIDYYTSNYNNSNNLGGINDIYSFDNKNEININFDNQYLLDFNNFIHKQKNKNINELAIIIPFYEYEKYETILQEKIPNTNTNIIKKKTITSKFYYLFYTEEDAEIQDKQKCSINQYYDIKNKTCINCKDKCNNKDICKTDYNCSLYCSNECDNITSIKNKSNSCGNTKTKDEIKKKNTDEKVLFDDDYKLPDFFVLFRYIIKIFFVAISFYLLYLFYQMFSEHILSFLNFMSNLFERTLYYFIFIWPRNTTQDAKLKLAEYRKDRAIRNYDKVTEKIAKISKEDEI